MSLAECQCRTGETQIRPHFHWLRSLAANGLDGLTITLVLDVYQWQSDEKSNTVELQRYPIGFCAILIMTLSMLLEISMTHS